MPQTSSTTTSPYVGFHPAQYPAWHLSRHARVNALPRLVCSLVSEQRDRELVPGQGGGIDSVGVVEAAGAGEGATVGTNAGVGASVRVGALRGVREQAAG